MQPTNILRDIKEDWEIPMKINLARSAGFCFGVKRAISMAMEAAQAGNKVDMLGDIVHNETVVRQIKKCGIRKIISLKKNKRRTLLIRAHGTSKDTISKALCLGYRIIDATCPMVKEIHRIAREEEKKGRHIIIIGDKKHDEVQGIIGNIRTHAIVIDPLHSLPARKIRKVNKAAVVVQSTQNIDEVKGIVNALKKQIPHLKFCNTVCRPTRTKQEEIKRMPLDNDAMIIIGSRASANSRRLYEISRSKNKHSYWVNDKKEVKKEWLKGAKNVGITAGASTPDAIIRDIVRYVKKIGN